MPTPPPPSRHRIAEFAGIAGLLALAIHFIALSWRKWPDPMIDFGRELYTPWRLANGAVLYRDVDDFYGPLSQYFNAALFRLFGPGLMVLVTANLAIYAGILAALYYLFRRAWGAAAAFAAAFVFVSVFSFSQLTTISNYNYAAPYAHEATHGLLVCLLLAIALLRWLEEPTTRRTLASGFLLGLTLVLKPEFILAGGLTTAAAAILRWKGNRVGDAPARRAEAWRRRVAWWAAGAILPTALFAVFFTFSVPAGDAIRNAGRAWWNIVSSADFVGDPIQALFLGFDAPGTHLVEHASTTLVAAALLGTLVLAGRFAGRPGQTPTGLAAGIIGPLALGAAGWLWIPWLAAGRCLFAFTAGYAALKFFQRVRSRGAAAAGDADAARLLLAVLAAALMARMILNGRLHQFGFYQAALAAMVVTAALIGEAHAWVGGASRTRAVIAAGTILLLSGGIAQLTTISRNGLAAKTMTIGEGRDEFLGYPDYVTMPRILTEFLRNQPESHTVLVVPQGLMVNYLSRKPSPLAPFFLFSAATANGREASLVSQLQQRPPNWVVIVNEDLSEYGIAKYGESVGSGKLIMEWAQANYQVAATARSDPDDPRKVGAFLLAPRSAVIP